MNAELLEYARIRLKAAPTALELAQGSPYPFDDDANAARFYPIDSGLDDYYGWLNPYKATIYPVTPDNVNSSQALQANFRRTYLLIQNKGPGNLFFNFGQAASALISISLVANQFGEWLGGGAGGCFVPRDSIWILTDVAGTTAIIGEGIEVPTFNLQRR